MGKIDLASKYGECSHNIIQPFSWLDIMRKHDVIVWLRWINSNICQRFYVDDWKTMDVKLRIATGMLNKLTSLTDEEKIKIHCNLTTNVKKAKIDVELESLPF